MLDADSQRAPVILAVAERLTTPERLRQALESQPRLGGRRHLVNLIDKLAAGCRSPLELWGYEKILTAPGMPRFSWQRRVALGDHVVYLDAYDEASRVNVELDGAKYHRDPVDRERDLRRDSGLAALGITVVRFTHARLMREPDDVRREILAIIWSRRRG
jgi:very-short-patch-repair endonuclease